MDMEGSRLETDTGRMLRSDKSGCMPTFIYLLLGILALAFIIRACGIDEPSTSNVGNATTTRVTTTTTTAPKQAGIGDIVRDGRFQFVVTGVEQPGKIIEDGLLSYEAIGTWFAVRLHVVNVGNEAQTFFASDQKLMYGSRTYGAEGYTWTGYGSVELNPGLEIDTGILFDVPESFPKDGLGTMLQFHDSVFSGGIEVWL